MEKEAHFPLKTHSGSKIQDRWLSKIKPDEYNQDLLEGFLYSRFGYPGIGGPKLDLQPIADKRYRELSDDQKQHSPTATHNMFFMTDPLEAVRKSRIGGICGSARRTERFDVAVDCDTGRIMLIDIKNESMKETGIEAEKLRFYILKDEIQGFRSRLKDPKKRPDELDNPDPESEIKAIYFAKLNAQDNSSKPLPKKMFIYIKNLRDLIRFNNSLLFGNHRKRDRETLDPKNRIKTATGILRHKIFLAEKFYKLMYKRCQAHIPKKENITEARVPLPRPELQLKAPPPEIPKKPKFDTFNLDKAFNLLRKARERAQRRARFLELRIHKDEEKKKRVFDEDIDLAVDKVFVINRGKEMEGTLPEYHAGFTRKKITPQNFDPRLLEKDRIIGLEPHSKNQRLQCGLFNVLAECRDLFPIDEIGYFCIYTLDPMENSITALGIHPITPEMRRVERIDLLTYPDNSQTHSIVNYIRKDLQYGDEEDIPELRQLLAPKNYGFMMKYREVKGEKQHDDQILDFRGEGTCFASLRGLMMMEYRMLNEGSEIERNNYINVDWEKFERFLESSYRENLMHPDLIISEKKFFDKLSSLDDLRRISTATLSNNDDSRSFLYFSRQNWGVMPEFKRNIEIYQTSMVAGPPDFLCIPVWCSLGKVQLIKIMARSLVEARSRVDNLLMTSQQSTNTYQFLKHKGLALLEESDSVRLDIELISGHRMLPKPKKDILKNLVSAYLQYSKLLTDSTKADMKFMMRMYSLRNVCGLSAIALELTELQQKGATGGVRGGERSKVSEEDCFWLMLSIAFVFLPEHYLIPITNKSKQKESDNSDKVIEELGLRLEKNLKNKVFETVNSTGNNKLSLVLCYLVQEAHPAIHTKLTDLGFPFLSFCQESIDELFTNLLNRPKLYRVWNLIFFEGASNKNRRAQQIILSTMLALFKLAQASILQAETSEELLWSLKAYGMLDFNPEEFVNVLLEIRSKHFVTSGEEEDGFFSRIGKGFADIFSTSIKLERDISIIYKDFKSRFSYIAKSNSNMLRLIGVFEAQRVANGGGKVTGRDLKKILNALEEEYSAAKGYPVLVFKDIKTSKALVIAEKKQPVSIQCGIAHADFGGKMTEGSEIEITYSFAGFKKLLAPKDVHSFI